MPAHNEKVERLSLLMQRNWTIERKGLYAESIKEIGTVKYNLSMRCMNI
jgi:hypothetical protein